MDGQIIGLVAVIMSLRYSSRCHVRLLPGAQIALAKNVLRPSLEE